MPGNRREGGGREEESFLDRSQIKTTLVKFFKVEMVKRGVEFSDHQARMSNIVTLPREITKGVMKVRGKMIERGTEHLEMLTRNSCVDPNFDHSIAGKAALVGEALEQAIKEDNMEKGKQDKKD